MRERWAVALLVFVLAGQLAWGLVSDGLTIDELVYIGAGYRHLTASDYRLVPSHPPLAKMLAALPLLGLRLDVPDLAPSEGEWSWSYRFIHVVNRDRPITAWARVPAVVAALLLAALLWAWARSAWGRGAGLTALALTVFHTSILAHGHLATTDMVSALTTLAASWCFWWWSQGPSLRRATLVAVAVGLAVSARLTGWLLLPSFALIVPLALLGKPREAWRTFGLQLLHLTWVLVLTVPLLIWALHGWHYAPWPGATVAQVPGPWLGSAGRAIAWMERARILPEAYLEGLRYQVEHNTIGHPTYLLGRVSNTGWPHYFLVAFAVKNTPVFLAAVLATLALLVRRGRDVLAGSIEAHALAPALVLFVTASFGRIQIGERYILPVYGYLILLAAELVPRALSFRRGRVVLGLVLALHAMPAVLTAPRGYLTYFNLLAGGTDRAHRVLLDSNLDWGQDLPRLAGWMRGHGIGAVQLGYHGSDDPERYGIVHEDLPGLSLYPKRPPAEPFRGVVAVSPNVLMGIFAPPGGNPYAALVGRAPDDRAGALFIYRLRP